MSELEKEFESMSWDDAKGGVARCITSLQSEVNFLKEKAMMQQQLIDRLLTVNETIVKILGEKLS